MASVLTTERLEIKELTLQDTSFIIELLNTPGWLQYIGDRMVRDEQSAQNYLLNGPLKSYQLNGFGLNKVELKATGLPIGMCGLLKRDTLETVDIGFAFLPAYSGKGYAYEAAKAVLEYAYRVLNFERVLAIVTPTNEASLKLLGKLSFNDRGTIKMPPTNEELRLLEGSMENLFDKN
jgi:RimJ/RimL family protein N-acetyltransferase